ncbi:hypothetical protein [Bradyrhizobium sp. STM 3557]|uniref:hypothetical protein n=1 Tax=Bradyrhizobium sp. STM 3557 TaxID=578920 RepID=UPI00388F351D
MFDLKSRTEIVGNELLVNEPSGYRWRLERDPCILILESTELVVRSALDWPLDPDEDQGVPTFSTSISASLKPIRHRMYAFKGERLLGQVEVASLWCRTADTNRVIANIFEPNDGSGVEKLTLGITCALTESMFKEVFHPIWLRQSKSVLDAIFYIDGYESAADRAFREADDIRQSVFQADAALKVRFRSLSLRTSLSAAPQAQND